MPLLMAPKEDYNLDNGYTSLALFSDHRFAFLCSFEELAPLLVILAFGVGPTFTSAF